ncbi:hypothetical protein FOL47_007712 [Perkinsus chesapeaki]|uniref:Zinc transporter n=1 Tax=Perkinsus chesapeaki TaxID=330153 RepID=A0A7J6LIP0_PERCH|nr:hypothetical protein FOL47_007712 [Perkinsus chesapeaki]
MSPDLIIKIVVILVEVVVAFVGLLLASVAGRGSLWFGCGCALASGVMLSVAFNHMLDGASTTLKAYLDFPLGQCLAGNAFILLFLLDKLIHTYSVAKVISEDGEVDEEASKVNAGDTVRSEGPAAAVSESSPKGIFSAILVFVALTIHSLAEGLSLGSAVGVKSTLAISVASIAHKGLAAYALGVALASASMTKQATWAQWVAFALSTPLGIAFGMIISQTVEATADLVSAIFSGLAAGTFIYVCTIEFLPMAFEEHTTQTLGKGIMLLLGYAFMASSPSPRVITSPVSSDRLGLLEGQVRSLQAQVSRLCASVPDAKSVTSAPPPRDTQVASELHELRSTVAQLCYELKRISGVHPAPDAAPPTPVPPGSPIGKPSDGDMWEPKNATSQAGGKGVSGVVSLSENYGVIGDNDDDALSVAEQIVKEALGEICSRKQRRSTAGITRQSSSVVGSTFAAAGPSNTVPVPPITGKTLLRTGYSHSAGGGLWGTKGQEIRGAPQVRESFASLPSAGLPPLHRDATQAVVAGEGAKRASTPALVSPRNSLQRSISPRSSLAHRLSSPRVKGSRLFVSAGSPGWGLSREGNRSPRRSATSPTPRSPPPGKEQSQSLLQCEDGGGPAMVTSENLVKETYSRIISKYGSLEDCIEALCKGEGTFNLFTRFEPIDFAAIVEQVGMTPKEGRRLFRLLDTQRIGLVTFRDLASAATQPSGQSSRASRVSHSGHRRPSRRVSSAVDTKQAQNTVGMPGGPQQGVQVKVNPPVPSRAASSPTRVVNAAGLARPMLPQYNASSTSVGVYSPPGPYTLSAPQQQQQQQTKFMSRTPSTDLSLKSGAAALVVVALYLIMPSDKKSGADKNKPYVSLVPILILIYMIGMLIADMTFDIQGDGEQCKVYYCHQLDNLQTPMGAARVFIPTAVAGVIILKDYYLNANNKLAPMHCVSLQAIAMVLLILLGCGTMGLSLMTVHSACPNRTPEEWVVIVRKTLLPVHIVMGFTLASAAILLWLARQALDTRVTNPSGKQD